MSVVETRTALPECTMLTSPRLTLIADEKALTVCYEGDWQSVTLTASAGGQAAAVSGASGLQWDPRPVGDSGSPGAKGMDGAHGADGPSGPKGDTGMTGAAGPAWVYRTKPEGAGLNCGLSGLLLQGGVDSDGDGQLDDAEITSSGFLCSPRPAARRVFISSQTYGGNLGGAAGADAKCQALASTVPALSGRTFRAWLGTSMTSTPASTFPRDASLGFVRTDGVKIADDWADLTDGSLDAKLNVTETGAVSTNTATWLGTLADGTYLRGPWTNCDDFTQNTTSTAVRGIPTNTNGTLGPTSDASLPGIPCTGAAAIYCFEP